MILVTGAGGKTGQAVVEALSNRGAAIRALVRRDEQVPGMAELGADEVVVADLQDPAEMQVAMGGAQSAYLIVPNVHPEEVRIGEVAIAAARDAGVERIVYHSVLHPQIKEMPHHWQKLAVEERLFESGLPFTILQPAAYMQNLLPYWDEIVEEGIYRVPYGERAALSLVDLEDVAAVAAEILASSGHNGATYELAGPQALSPGQIAEVLSTQLRSEIRSEAVALNDWAVEARGQGLGGYPLDSLSKMFGYYDRHGLIGNSRVLECLLGRPPTSFRQFVDRLSTA